MITFADKNLNMYEEVDMNKCPVQLCLDFLEYNFHVTAEGLQRTFRIYTEVVPNGMPLQAGIWFEIITRIASNFMKRKFEEWRDPYTGEVLQ